MTKRIIKIALNNESLLGWSEAAFVLILLPSISIVLVRFKLHEMGFEQE